MSGPDGITPDLVWPALLYPTQPYRMVYLDLNHWIALAKAATGHPSGERFVPVLEACRDFRRAGKGIFPLSNSHYVEISKIEDPRQRLDLASVMEELSGFITLINPTVLRKIELDTVLDTRLKASPIAWNDYPVLGYGVGFAFGRPMAPQLVLPDGTDVTEQYRSTEKGAALLKDMAVMLERRVLAGPSDEERPVLNSQGWDPRAGWRVAEARAQQERDQAIRIDDATDRNWRKGRLRDMMGAREMLTELEETLHAAITERGGTHILEPWLTKRSEIRALVRSMPSSEVMVEFKTAMHRNRERALRWSANDVIDMDAMALAVPYCDIVVTENHACSVVTTAKLGARMNTVMLDDLLHLPRVLARN